MIFLIILLSIFQLSFSNTFFFNNSDFNVKSGGYIEIYKAIITDVVTSKDSGEVNSVLELNLDNEATSFDIIFLSDYSEEICYKSAIIQRNFSKNCNFTLQPILKQLNFSFNLLDIRNDLGIKISDWRSSSLLIILDNTPFPIDGSVGDNDLKISSIFNTYISSSNTYYYWTEGLAIAMGISLFLIFICIFVLYMKTKKIKDKNITDVLVNDNRSENRPKKASKDNKQKNKIELDDGSRSKKEILGNDAGILNPTLIVKDLKKERRLISFE